MGSFVRSVRNLVARAHRARWALVMGSSAAVALSACASGSSGTPPFMVVEPEDARLVAASNAIAARVGHTLSYEIDPKLTEEHRAEMRRLVATALETVAAAVDKARTEAPEDAARAALVLGKVTFERDERTRAPYARLDPETGTLALMVPTQATHFADETSIVDALLALPAP